MDNETERLLDAIRGGKTAFNSPCSSHTGLEAFQSTVNQLRSLKTSGHIEIINEHSESQTGHRFIDCVIIKRTNVE